MNETLQPANMHFSREAAYNFEPFNVDLTSTHLHIDLGTRISETPPNWLKIIDWVKKHTHKSERQQLPIHMRGYLAEAHVHNILESTSKIKPFLPVGQIQTSNFSFVRDYNGGILLKKKNNLQNFSSVDAIAIIGGVITVIEVKMTHHLSKTLSSRKNSRKGVLGSMRPKLVNEIFTPLKEYASENLGQSGLFAMMVVVPPEILSLAESHPLMESFQVAGGIIVGFPESLEDLTKHSEIVTPRILE